MSATYATGSSAEQGLDADLRIVWAVYRMMHSSVKFAGMVNSSGGSRVDGFLVNPGVLSGHHSDMAVD